MEMHNGYICIDIITSLQKKKILEVELKLLYLVSVILYFWSGILLRRCRCINRGEIGVITSEVYPSAEAKHRTAIQYLRHLLFFPVTSCSL